MSVALQVSLEQFFNFCYLRSMVNHLNNSAQHFHTLTSKVKLHEVNNIHWLQAAIAAMNETLPKLFNDSKT